MLILEHCAYDCLWDQIYERKKEKSEGMKHWRRQFEEPFVKTMIFDVASALSYIHKRGWVHLDLKPDNILLSKQG